MNTVFSSFFQRIQRVSVALLAVFMLSWPSVSLAQPVEEEPGMGAMIADLVVVRPVMLGVTAVGTAVWIVASPFTLMGGNWKSSAETLIGGPAETTFLRCLGCTRTGYQKDAQ